MSLRHPSKFDCGIYSITSPSGKKYIGSSNNIPNRWRAHKLELKKGVHHSPYLQNAWNKYQGDFKFEVLLVCPEDCLQLYEQQYLDFYRPEYNISPTAYSCRGIKRTPEFKENLRKLMTGNKYSVGVRPSEETRAKLRAASMGNKYAAGKRTTPVSQKHRDHLSLVGMGHTVSVETRNKISETFRLKRELKQSSHGTH